MNNVWATEIFLLFSLSYVLTTYGTLSHTKFSTVFRSIYLSTLHKCAHMHERPRARTHARTLTRTHEWCCPRQLSRAPGRTSGLSRKGRSPILLLEGNVQATYSTCKS